MRQAVDASHMQYVQCNRSMAILDLMHTGIYCKVVSAAELQHRRLHRSVCLQPQTAPDKNRLLVSWCNYIGQPQCFSASLVHCTSSRCCCCCCCYYLLNKSLSCLCALTASVWFNGYWCGGWWKQYFWFFFVVVASLIVCKCRSIHCCALLRYNSV